MSEKYFIRKFFNFVHKVGWGNVLPKVQSEEFVISILKNSYRLPNLTNSSKPLKDTFAFDMLRCFSPG